MNEASSSFVPMNKSAAIREPFFNFLLQQLESMNNSVGDAPNRIAILQQQLVNFCTTEDQIDILNQWRTGSYQALSNITITPSQAWEVV